MLIVNEIIGNIIADERWNKLYQQMRLERKAHTITLSRQESERCRLFKRLPEYNEEIGIDLKRGLVLHDGDILYYRTKEKMFIVRVEAEKMMALKFTGNVHEDALFEAAVKLGHAIGNQHWTMKVVGRTVFVPLSLDVKVMESVIKTHNIPGLEYVFEEVEGEKLCNENPMHSHTTPHSCHPHIHSHGNERNV